MSLPGELCNQEVSKAYIKTLVEYSTIIRLGTLCGRHQSVSTLAGSGRRALDPSNDHSEG